MTKTQKITAMIMAIGAAAFIAYDIFIVSEANDSTLSAVMFYLLKFPFIIFAWHVLGGHFSSPFKIKWRSIPLLIISGVIMLVLSILSILGIIIFSSLAICIICLSGFFVGALCWNQRGKK